jgi:hypothetical protein
VNIVSNLKGESMTKISLQELKNMFLVPRWGIGKVSLLNKPISKHQGSKKGYVSVQNHYMPPKSEITPKVWEEQQRARKLVLKNQKKEK